MADSKNRKCCDVTCKPRIRSPSVRHYIASQHFEFQLCLATRRWTVSRRSLALYWLVMMLSHCPNLVAIGCKEPINVTSVFGILGNTWGIPICKAGQERSARSAIRQKEVTSELHRVTKADDIRCRLRDGVQIWILDEGRLSENTVNQSFDWDLNLNWSKSGKFWESVIKFNEI